MTVEKAGTEQGSPRWKPGQSGNPKGRPAGSGEVAKLRASIAQHIPEILESLIEKAKDGDATAARLLLERVLPPVKAAEAPAEVSMPDGSLTDQGRAILQAAGAGNLAPGQAAQLLTSLAALAKLIETDEIERRLRELEQRMGDKR